MVENVLEGRLWRGSSTRKAVFVLEGGFWRGSSTGEAENVLGRVPGKCGKGWRAEKGRRGNNVPEKFVTLRQI